VNQDPTPARDRTTFRSADPPTTRLLTFETWVRNAAWYDYAVAHPETIPHLLIDRSPCQDPFFDPFAEPGHRRPVISGLCRGRAMRNLHIGDRFIYIARIDQRLGPRLGIEIGPGPHYFAVAALRVVHVWESHQEAAQAFSPRRYVSVPATTPYPPNLAFASNPEAAGGKGLLDHS
jgi:hypothetical protein